MMCMSAATDTARENARRRNGQFGNQEHTAPEVTLGARSKTETPVELARTLLAEHGLGHWKVRVDNAQRRLGVCYHQRQTISLSRQFLAVGTDEQAQDTILHEIAHALAGPDAGHGPEWKAIAERIGATPERCANGQAMRDARDRRREDADAAKRYGRGANIAPGTEVVIVDGQHYLRGMRATVLSRGTTRYLVETEDGQRFRARPEFLGQLPEAATEPSTDPTPPATPDVSGWGEWDEEEQIHVIDVDRIGLEAVTPGEHAYITAQVQQWLDGKRDLEAPAPVPIDAVTGSVQGVLRRDALQWYLDTVREHEDTFDDEVSFYGADGPLGVEREDGTIAILDGNHRFAAAKLRGEKTFTMQVLRFGW